MRGPQPSKQLVSRMLTGGWLMQGWDMVLPRGCGLASAGACAAASVPRRRPACLPVSASPACTRDFGGMWLTEAARCMLRAPAPAQPAVDQARVDRLRARVSLHTLPSPRAAALAARTSLVRSADPSSCALADRAPASRHCSDTRVRGR